STSCSTTSRVNFAFSPVSPIPTIPLTLQSVTSWTARPAWSTAGWKTPATFDSPCAKTKTASEVYDAIVHYDPAAFGQFSPAGGTGHRGDRIRRRRQGGLDR